jgi:hypothetical protein
MATTPVAVAVVLAQLVERQQMQMLAVVVRESLTQSQARQSHMLVVVVVAQEQEQALVALVAAAKVKWHQPQATPVRPTLVVVAAVQRTLFPQVEALAAAVLSLCALRVPTHLLTVQLQLVEQPREHTQVAAPHTITSRSTRQAH